jgi:hypothetical protein
VNIDDGGNAGLLLAGEVNSHVTTEATDSEKKALKTKAANCIIRELKRNGATDCKGSVSTRLLARVGHIDCSILAVQGTLAAGYDV